MKLEDILHTLHIPLPPFLSKNLRKINISLFLLLIAGLIFSEQERPQYVRDFILSLF